MNLYFLQNMCVICRDEWRGLTTIDCKACKEITHISNIDGLGHSVKLDIRWCPNLMSISNISNVHTINIEYCPKLNRMSNIRNVGDIKVSFCQNLEIIADIIYVGAFRTHLALIKQLHNIRDVVVLKTDLSRLEAISGISAADGFVWKNYAHLKSVSGVALSNSVFENCPMLTDVSFTMTMDVVIRNCPWMPGDDSFEENMKKLIFLQEYIKWKLHYRRTVKLRELDKYMIPDLRKITMEF